MKKIALLGVLASTASATPVHVGHFGCHATLAETTQVVNKAFENVCGNKDNVTFFDMHTNYCETHEGQGGEEYTLKYVCMPKKEYIQYLKGE